MWVGGGGDVVEVTVGRQDGGCSPLRAIFLSLSSSTFFVRPSLAIARERVRLAVDLGARLTLLMGVLFFLALCWPPVSTVDV